MMSINQIIKEVTRYADAYEMVYSNPLIKELQNIIAVNNETTFSKLEYRNEELSEDSNEIVKAVKSENREFKVFKGKGFIPRINLKTKDQYFEERDLIKIRDDKNGFTFQFSINLQQEAKHIYVVFLERDTLLQGNFYEAKKFIHGPLSRIFFDALGFDSLMGKAVWSSNSEVRNSKARDTDWRDSKRPAYYKCRDKKVPVTGLQKFYLLCGFVFLNQLIGNNPESKDQMVLLNPNKYGEERNKLNKNFSFDINKISTPLEEEITLIS
jgi:hypothetical protein